MGCFHNLHNQDNKQRAEAFFEAGHYGMACTFYQRAMEDLQRRNVYQHNQLQEIDLIQKKIRICRQHLKRVG